MYSPLSKSPLKKFAFVAVSALCIGQSVRAANTATVFSNSATDLSVGANYTPTITPTAASAFDVQFSGAYAAPTLTISGSNLVFGTLDDLDTTDALVITNGSATAGSISLSNASSNSTPNTATNDVLYVAPSGNLTIQSGVGVLTLNLTVTGNIDNAGTLALSSPINITAGKTISFTGAGATTVNGNIANTTGAVTINDAGGSVTLGGSNSFTGATSLAAGTLNINSQYALQNSVLTQTAGSTLSFVSPGAAFNVGGLAGSTALALQNSASAAITLNLGNSVLTAATYSGNLSGGGSIVKIGSNTQTLSGTNSYTGTTTVSAGILEFATESSLYSNNTVAGGWTASNIIVQPGATLAFEVGNAGGFTASDLATLSGLGTSTGGFENGSTLGIDTTGATFTFGGVIANTNGGANVIGLNKLGANSLILTGSNTYTGPTTVTAGTLQLGNSGTNGSLASSSIANSTGLVFAPAAGTTESYSGNIGGAGAVTINGAATGTTILSGNNINTGLTTVTSGTLNVASSLALQNSNLSPANGTDVTFDSGVTSNAFTIGALSNNQNLVLNNTAGAGINLTIGNVNNNLSTGPYTAAFSGLGGITQAGYRNTLSLTGSNTYSGTTTVTGGTLNLGNGGANGSIGVNGSAGPLVLGGFDNGGTLAYTRTGTVAQTFSGTTINAGGNAITESTATQTINLGAITSNPGGTVDIGSTGTVTTTSGNTNGILGGYATYGGKTTFAVAPSTPGGAITGLAAGAYTTTATAGTTPANYLNQNIDVSTVTPTGAITPNSLRFNTASQTLTLTGVNTVTSGGILVTPTGGSSTINGGFLTGSAGGQLAVSSPNQNFTINSTVEDNGAATALTLSSNSNAGRYFSLGSGNNSFSGGVFINGGGVNVPGNNSTALGVGTVTFGNQVYTGAAGGGITFGTFAKVLTSGLLASADSDNSSNGEISGNSGGIWELVGSGTATFSGIIGSYSPGRVVNPQLDSGTQIFGNQQIGISNLIVNGGTFQLGTGYWGSISNSKQNVALTVGGGTYVQFGNYAGTTSQVYNSGLTVNSGASTITVNGNGGAGTVLSFAAVGSRAVGGTVNFNLPTNLGGTQTASNGITTSQLNTNGILGGYATVGGNDWATNATNTAGGNIIGLSTSTINGYAPDVFASGSNTDVTAADVGVTGTTNSLRFNNGTGSVALAGTEVISSGGILVTSNVGAVTPTISGGTLEGSGTDLIVIQNNASGGLEIDSPITNNVTATGLTKSGAGLLTLTASNSYTGVLTLNGGVLSTGSNGINAGSAVSGIVLNGGTLQATNNITTSKAVTVNPNGGTIDTNGNSVTLSGNLTGGIVVGAGLVGSFDPTGEASFTKTGAGTLTLAGAANAFTGAFIVNNGTVVDGAAAAGTLGSGYLTFGNNGNTPTVDLNGHNATVAGLIGAGGNGVIINNAASTSSTITLNGNFSESYSGIIQNGASTTGTVGLTENLTNSTETVTLAGANSYTGATAVTSGKLLISGSLTSTSSVSVGANGTLAVNGSVNTAATISDIAGRVQGQGTIGTVNVSGSGTLAPGFTTVNNAAGTLTAANATLDNTSKFNIRLGVSAVGGTDNDALSVQTGTVGLNGSTLNLTLGNTFANAAVGTFYNIILGGGNSSGFGTGSNFFSNAMPTNGIGTITSGNYTFNVIYGSDGTTDGTALVGNDVSLELIAAVPEPQTWAMLLSGVGVLGMWQRSRRRGTAGKF